MFSFWYGVIPLFRSDTEVGVAGWQTESEDDSMEQLNQIGPLPAKVHQTFGILLSLLQNKRSKFAAQFLSVLHFFKLSPVMPMTSPKL